MRQEQPYDTKYFMGESPFRGKFNLVDIDGKYYSRVDEFFMYAKDKLKFVEPLVVADIGAGAVNFARAIKNKNESKISRVDSFDISDAGYQIIKKQEERFNFVVSDSMELPVKDESYDVVVAWDVIEHLNNPDKALQECTRILKKGGLLTIVVPNPDSYKKGTSEDTYFRDQTHINPPIISVKYFKEKLVLPMYKNILVRTRGFRETKEYTQNNNGRDLFKEEGGTHIVVYAQKS